MSKDVGARPTERAEHQHPLRNDEANGSVAGTAKRGFQAALAGYSGENEWYTPAEWIERARAAMGSIDCDPATSALAQRTVKAAQWHGKECDGLQQPWRGNIWLNPPYARGLIERFVDKLVSERDNFEQAIVLVDNRTDTRWFHKLCSTADAVAFTRGRIGFYNDEVERSSPANGSVLFYIGAHRDRFRQAFEESCAVLYPADLRNGKEARKNRQSSTTLST